MAFRFGPKYEYVQIGTQNWMNRNLDVPIYRNGDPIPNITDPYEWQVTTGGAWCYYNNDPTTARIYGRLYNWYAVNEPRGLAPYGWHIPTDSEWTTLTTTLGGESIAGGTMKEAGITHWKSPNTGATNSSGFTALPAGYSVGYAFFAIGELAVYWTSSNAFYGQTWYRGIGYNFTDCGRYASNKTNGYSVRCIKD